MRIARSVLENVAGLEIFAIIGILLFFAFFVGLMIYVLRMKKSHVDAYSRLPLGEDDEVEGQKSNLDYEMVESRRSKVKGTKSKKQKTKEQ